MINWLEVEDFSGYSDAELQKAYEDCMTQSQVYDVSQKVKKVLLNSQYGAFASPYFLYYNVNVAEAITATGQFYLLYARRTVDDFISKMLELKESKDFAVAGDTDSVYLEVGDLIDKFFPNGYEEDKLIDFVDKFFVYIEEHVHNKAFEEVRVCNNYVHGKDIMHMDREAICIPNRKTNCCGLWQAKKHYALTVNDMEGVRYPLDHTKLKVMGLSMIQSSTPEVCRGNLEKVTRMYIEEGIDAVREYEKQVKKEFFEKTPEEIALPRGVSNVEKYVGDNGMPILGTPVQSKASIYYNRLLEAKGLEKQYLPIRDGEKIKFLYLKDNQYGIDVIGFHDELPKEFGLEKAVDYQSHYEKAFYKPLDDLLGSCGDSLEKKIDMDGFEDFFA